MGGEELKYINEAFATNWIAPIGQNIDTFEKQICNYVGIENCAVLSSGTAAIHLALLVLGVQQKDEVICSSFTFSGSCNPIMYLGATPVFVDSELETWNMDPNLLETAILERQKVRGSYPKAIIVVHLYGMPAKMDEILEVSRKYDIPVIEDAAEALGSSYKGKKLGGFGDIGIFSFNGNKIITTSGGGAMVSSNKKWIDKAKFLATQARDNAPHYQHSFVGYNYRMSNICAGIGVGQMNVLDQRVQARRKVFNRYASTLTDISAIEFQKETTGNLSNRWLTSFIINSVGPNKVTSEQIRLKLEENNIESRPLWKPMHMQPVFSGLPCYVNGTSEGLFLRGLCLPSGSNLDEFDQDKVIHQIRELFGG